MIDDVIVDFGLKMSLCAGGHSNFMNAAMQAGLSKINPVTQSTSTHHITRVVTAGEHGHVENGHHSPPPVGATITIPSTSGGTSTIIDTAMANAGGSENNPLELITTTRINGHPQVTVVRRQTGGSTTKYSRIMLTFKSFIFGAVNIHLILYKLDLLRCIFVKNIYFSEQPFCSLHLCFFFVCFYES